MHQGYHPVKTVCVSFHAYDILVHVSCSITSKGVLFDWGDFGFVLWCMIMLELIIRKVVDCAPERMHMVSNNT